MKHLLTFLAATVLTAHAGDTVAHYAILKSFSKLGAKTYSYKPNYSKLISDMYLAYDEKGVIVAGAGMRKFKTYKKVTSTLVVARKEGAYVVAKADVPDFFVIKEIKKRKKVMDAVSAVNDKTVKDASGKQVSVDAVTGATRYQKRLYANFNAMARKIVEQMEAKPEWQKKAIPFK